MDSLNEFDFPLPAELIAPTPAEPRDACRLLHYRLTDSKISHYCFQDLRKLLRSGDALILNQTKVLPARLFGTHGERRFEILLLAPTETPLVWECLCRPAKKLPKSATLQFPDGVSGQLCRLHEERFEIRFSGVEPTQLSLWLDRNGQIPLPPYVKRHPNDSDSKDYQTVFATELGSVAAPTAGLHFTKPLLAQLEALGVRVYRLTLHVGYATFAPMRTHRLEDHKMHWERYEIDPKLPERLREIRKGGGRCIAVGTTVVRALESMEKFGYQAQTNLFIRPGHRFRWIDGLITNFHLPKTSLLVLVASLMGKEALKHCYAQAIQERYRFFSYGDAMLIL